MIASTMSLLLRSLLLCLTLTSSISGDPSPSCRSLSDYTHQLSQRELEGRWYLFYSAAHESGLGTIISSVLDFHVTDDDHAQVRQVIKHNHLVRTEAHEMQITKANNSYRLTAKEDDHTFSVYPMKDHVILYEDEGGVRLYSQSNTTSYSSEEDFKHLSKCLGYRIINVHVISTPDSEHSDQDCQDYELITKAATLSEIVGKMALYLSAYTKKEYAKWDQKLTFVLHKYELEGEKLKGKHLFGLDGSLQHYHSTPHMEEENGVIIIRDSQSNITMKAYNVGDSCVGLTLSPESVSNYTGFLVIYCRPGAVSDEVTQEFVQHARCQKFPHTFLRKDSAKLAFSCEDVAPTVERVTAEELAGRWHSVASASSFGGPMESEGQWVQIEVQDGDLKFTDSSRFPTPIPVTISGNTMTFRPEPADKVTVTFYEMGEDFLLANIDVKCSWGKYNSLNLFSKSGNADAKQIERFKQAASCVSLPVLYTKQ
ncbi:uncharacterized protein LOC134949616 [Pseudophryne corroboree]|uniref:uncharacterized protein LOC134949616 n=1 Tax=Pseudophryne corroboree TaxID=495146 RepID=UPI003081373E